jgi:hypothetical protein
MHGESMNVKNKKSVTFVSCKGILEISLCHVILQYVTTLVKKL